MAVRITPPTANSYSSPPSRWKSQVLGYFSGRTHECLREMYASVSSHYDACTVGELSIPYVSVVSVELNMMM